MRVTVQPKEFREAVAWATHWVPARPERPAWAGLRLFSDGDIDLRLVAFDGDTAAETYLRGEVAEPGDVAVSGRLLAALVAVLPAKAPVTITASDVRLTLTAGTVVMTLPLMEPEKRAFTSPPTVARIDAEALADGVKRVERAASKEGFSEDFTQIRLEFLDDRFTVMAMDGRRAAIAAGAATPAATGPAAVTVTARVLADVAGTLGSGEIFVSANEQLASFAGNCRILTTRQWAKQYRTKIIAAALSWSPDAYAIVPTQPLVEALKRAVVTRTESEPTELGWSEGELTVKASGATEATVADAIAIEYDGLPATIFVNPVLLGEAVTCAGGEKTRIAFEPANPIRPLRVTDPDDEDYVHILTPIRPVFQPPKTGPYARK